MPRTAITDRIPEVDPKAAPTLILHVKHNADRFAYEYRFFGDDGRAKVDVYDRTDPVGLIDRPDPPKYTINQHGMHEGPECAGFSFRRDCKHVRTARAVWNTWGLAARVYFRLEKPVGTVSDHMLTTGTLFEGWLRKFYAANAPYDPADPEGFAVDLLI